MLARLLQKKRFVVGIGILVAIVPILCLALFIKFSLFSDLQRKAVQQRQTYAIAAAQILGERLEGEVVFGNAYASRQMLQQAIVSRRQPEIEHHLRNLIETSNSLTRAYVAATDGTMLAAYPSYEAIIGKDFSHRDWFRQTSRAGKPYVSEFFLRAAEPHKYIFTITLPIKNAAGTPIGILVLEPNDDFLRHALDSIKTGVNGAIYVVDKHGMLIFHQQFPVDRLINYATVPAVAKVIRQQAGADISFNPVTGADEVAAYHHVANSGWGVVTVQPLQEVLAPLRRVETGIFVFLGIMLLLAGYNAYRWAIMLTVARNTAMDLERANELLQEQSDQLQAQSEELQAQNEELQCQSEELAMQGEELQAQNDELEKMRQHLFQYNEQLMAKVQEQTSALTQELEQHRQTEQERRQATEEMKLLEQQLRQAQKMEAIGQLAGGVAHDFNNILTVIDGYGSILQSELPPDDPRKENINQILAASEKAANLTRSLLAFSRKQLMNPQATDLNGIVRNVVKFLQRILGEDIQLTTISRTAQLSIHADIGQIEQVLMNLATNARDAMPNGGTLTIETDLQAIDDTFVKLHGFAVPPGHYAAISISDNGCGMDEETRRKIFEPFFTTKDAGKGTGLGMAMVYGIVKQHNGFINVYSELGQGTTFRIYLPLHHGTEAVPSAPRSTGTVKGGSETILLAEDDPAVRQLMEKILRSYGYQVLLAEDGQHAVEVFAAHQECIDLVLLDVIMPRKNGREASREIRQLKPEVKVLFASGYTAEFIQSQAGFTEETALIMKPVKPRELIEKIGEMLAC